MTKAMVGPDRGVQRRKRAANAVRREVYSDPMQRAISRMEELLAMGLSCNAIAEQWHVNAGYTYRLKEMMDAGDVRWLQGLVDQLYPDEGWQTEVVAFCRGSVKKASLPHYRIGNSRLYNRVCPITGKEFKTPYHQQKFHPLCTEAMKKRYYRQQKRGVA